MVPLWEGLVNTNSISARIRLIGVTKLPTSFGVGDYISVSMNQTRRINSITKISENFYLDLDGNMATSGDATALIFKLDRVSLRTALRLDQYLNQANQPRVRFEEIIGRLLDDTLELGDPIDIPEYVPFKTFVQSKYSEFNNAIVSLYQSFSLSGNHLAMNDYLNFKKNSTLFANFITQDIHIVDGVDTVNDPNQILSVSRDEPRYAINHNGTALELPTTTSIPYVYLNSGRVGICPTYDYTNHADISQLVSNDENRLTVRMRDSRFNPGTHERLIIDTQNTIDGVSIATLPLTTHQGKRTCSIVVDRIGARYIAVGYSDSGIIDTQGLAIVDLESSTYTYGENQSPIVGVSIEKLTSTQSIVNLVVDVSDDEPVHQLVVGFTSPDGTTVNYAPDADNVLSVQHIEVRNGISPFDYAPLFTANVPLGGDTIYIDTATNHRAEGVHGTWVFDWSAVGLDLTDEQLTIVKHYSGNPQADGKFVIKAAYVNGQISISVSSPTISGSTISATLNKATDYIYRTVVVQVESTLSVYTNGVHIGNIDIEPVATTRGGVLLSHTENKGKGAVLYRLIGYSPTYADLAGALRISNKPKLY